MPGHARPPVADPAEIRNVFGAELRRDSQAFPVLASVFINFLSYGNYGIAGHLRDNLTTKGKYLFKYNNIFII